MPGRTVSSGCINTEVAELQARLAEAQEMLNAIRLGKVDALVVSGPEGDRVFSLTGAEHPYRVLIEEMAEGAATLSSEGTVVYCNRRLSALVGKEFERVCGSAFETLIVPDSRPVFASLLAGAQQGRIEGDVECLKDGKRLTLRLSLNRLPLGYAGAISLIAVDISERVSAQRHTEAENTRLATAIAQAANGIVITDTQGVIQYVNPAFTQMTGYSAMEAIGQNPRVLKSGRQGGAYYAELWQTIRRGQVWHGELINRRKDGTLYTEGMTIAPVRDSSGVITNFVAIKQDVTERQRAEEDLRRSERYLADAERTSHTGSWAWNVSTQEVTYWSQENYRIWGFEQAQGVPTFDQARERIHPEDQSAHAQAVEESIRENKDFELYFRIVLPDGSIRDIHSIGRRVLNEQAELVELTGVHIDITERKRAEAALRASEERYRDLFDNANDLIQSTDAEGRFVYVNRAWRDTLGYSEEEVGRLSVRDIVDPDSKAHCLALFGRVMSGESASPIEAAFRAKNGQKVIVEGSVNCTFKDDKPTPTRAILRDISERKRTEAQIEERNRLATLAAETGIALARAETLREGLQQCAEALVRHLDAAFARIWTLNEPEQMLELQASAGLYTHIDGAHGRVRVGKLKIGRIAQSGEPHITNTVTEDSWVGDTEWARREGMVAFAGFPLILEGRVVGVVAAFARHRLSDTAMAGFAAVADAVGQFIERKRAEEERQKFVSLVETSRDFIGIATLAGDVTYINDAGRKLVGMDEVEITLPKHLLEFLAEAARKQVQEVVMPLFMKTGYWQGEMQFQNLKTLEPIDVDMTASLVLDPKTGQPLCMCTISRDARPRKRAEEALQKEKAFTDAIIDSIPGHFYVVDKSGRYLRGNKNTEKILGYSRQELAEMDFLATIAEPDRPVVASKLLDAFTEGSASTEAHLLTKDGRTIPYFLTGTRGGSGDKVYLVGVGIDITERTHAEEELRESEEKFRSLATSAQDAIILLDHEGAVSYWNEAAAKIFGYSSDEALGREVHTLLTPQRFYEASQKGFANFRQTGEGPVVGKTLELVAVRKDGTEFPVELSLSALQLRNRWASLGILRDITQRKQAETEMCAAKRAAEAASQAKSDFLANMSHEIRTPMNAIMGMTDLVLDTELTPRQREDLNTVKTSADSLLRVINDILDFSKIEARKLDLERIDFNLRSCVEGACKSLSVRSAQKKLELVCHCAPDLPAMVLGDPGRLRQILVNLVGNAIKFTEQGEVVVHVEKLSGTADEGTLHFSVSDSGIGIPPEKQKSIFAAFTQADTSSTRRFGGTGLGLAIASQLVAMMRGRIWVESAVGRGSTFHFTVRMDVPNPPPEQPVQARIAVLQDLPVLVVDDNAASRRALGEVLSGWGVRPTASSGASQALTCLQQARDGGKPYRIVIADAQMPEVDGCTLIERIKQDPQLAGVPIILTSSGQPGDAADCRELGVSAYLTKPIGEAELLEAILQVLGERESAGQSQSITRHSSNETRRNFRILLVEDNPVNQLLGARLLQTRGHSVVGAVSGRQALAALEKETFDLVLMDVQMPEMDGLEATAAIRDMERTSGKHLPIIAMTAHAMRGDRERCLSAGMDGYVAKPVNSKDLYAAIENVMDHRKGHSQSE